EVRAHAGVPQQGALRPHVQSWGSLIEPSNPSRGASRPVVGCRLPAAGQRVVPAPVDQPVRQLQLLRRGTEDLDHVLSRDRAGLRGQTRADIGPGEDLVVDDDPVLEEDRATIDSDEPGVDVIAVSESEGLAEADRLRADDTAPPLGLEGLPYPAADHH